jgi:hypothetical protein
MIDAKEAVKRAMAYFLNLVENKDLPGLELEEVEKSEDGLYWLITLSYVRRVLLSEHRIYKQFKVEAQTGEVVSMTIRQLDASQLS